MGILLVTSAWLGSGATSLSSALAACLAVEGRKVGYIKPVAINVEEDADTRLFSDIVLPGQKSVLEPLVSSNLEDLQKKGNPETKLAETVKAAVVGLAQDVGVVMLEGPPLFSCNDESIDSSVVLAKALEAKVLVVIPFTPDLSADDVVSIANLVNEQLLGVIINNIPRYRNLEVKEKLVPAIEVKGIKVLGSIPEDRLMASVTVDQIACHLGGRWVVGQEKGQNLVEYFTIGGNVMDWGVDYFSRHANKAVIVRGNRPDLQMASLSTPTSCLVLTEGSDPIEYVYHEANMRDVPVIVVDSGTVETAEALGEIVKKAVVHHPTKFQKFHQLVTEHVDVGVIQKGLL